jgi:GDPmannose 4,6-dehydratase
VTRKITMAPARIKTGLQNDLYLGNTDAKRDWGFAGDYVKMMWMMLQQEEPADYVIASGIGHTIREFCQAAFAHLDLDYRDYVIFDPKLFRPVEEVPLIGDASLLRSKLEWKPEVDFSRLIELMVDADLKALTKQG